MIPKRPTKGQQRLARQLDRAVFATLGSRATSEEARALVNEVLARVVAWEQKSGKRTNKRGKTRERLRDAVEAFTGDLLRARGEPLNHGWVYRSRQAKSFSGERVGYRQFIAVTKALQELNLLEYRPPWRQLTDFGGGKVPYISKAPRFRAARRLVKLAEQGGVKPEKVDDHFLEDLPKRPVALRAASTWAYGSKYRGRPLKVPDTAKVRAIADDVRELNEFLRQFKIRGGIHRYYFRGFNNGDDPRFKWNLGGRLYSPGEMSYQQMERDDRLKMTIEGEPVCEIDISASYLTVFLGWHSEQIELGKDPYSKGDLSREDREAVKQWFVATCGSGKLATKWAKGAPAEFRKRTGKDLSRFSTDRILNAALNAYPSLAKWPDDSRTWADLMWVESEAIINTMLYLKRELGVPSLAVHDSLIVPRTQQPVAEWRLSFSYTQAAHAQPIIKTRLPEGYGHVYPWDTPKKTDARD